MKTLLTITTLVFTVMFSSPSYSKWTKVFKNIEGTTFYVDYERIRKVDGYVYWWEMSNYINPPTGYFSAKIYNQGDCKLFRVKALSFHFHKEPMGGDVGKRYNPKNQKWEYPTPNSSIESILKSVCSR